MSDLPPPEPTPDAPPARRLWFSVSVASSILIHVLILGWLLLPRVEALPPPEEPVNVDLVTEEEASAADAQSSSEEDMSSAAPSSEQPSSAAPSSAEPSSAEPSSSAASAASSAEPASTASSAEARAAPQPAPRPAGRTIIPVGQASSAEAASTSAESSGAPSSAAASEESPSVLTATGAGEDGAADSSAASELPSAPPDISSSAEENGPLMPVGGGALLPATRFYLEDMLNAPELAQARDAIAQLSPERRLTQTCNIEAMGQAQGAGYLPDTIIANAFAAPTIASPTYQVSGGVFRAQGKWRRIAYECTLSDELTEVTAFDFHIGDDVTAEIEARLSSNQ